MNRNKNKKIKKRKLLAALNHGEESTLYFTMEDLKVIRRSWRTPKKSRIIKMVESREIERLIIQLQNKVNDFETWFSTNLNELDNVKPMLLVHSKEGRQQLKNLINYVEKISI